MAGDGGAATGGGGGGTCPRLRSRPGPQLSGRAGRTEPIPLRPRPGPQVSRMGVKLRLPRPGRGAGGAGERPAGHGGRHGGTGARPDQLHGALRGPGTRPGASEAEDGGASHGSVCSPPRPHRSWSRCPYRSRLVRRGVRLVPSMVPRPGRCLPASPCCDYRLSKVSPEPAPLTVEQVPLRGGRPQLRSAPSWPPRPPPRHWLGPTARAGGSAPPGTPVRPGTALVGVLAFVRCDRSPSAPAPASETCCSVFLSQVSTHLFSLGPAARGMRDPCGKTQTSQLLFLWRGLS